MDHFHLFSGIPAHRTCRAGLCTSTVPGHPKIKEDKSDNQLAQDKSLIRLFSL
jgi:hypothetical protein